VRGSLLAQGGLQGGPMFNDYNLSEAQGEGTEGLVATRRNARLHLSSAILRPFILSAV